MTLYLVSSWISHTWPSSGVPEDVPPLRLFRCRSFHVYFMVATAPLLSVAALRPAWRGDFFLSRAYNPPPFHLSLPTLPDLDHRVTFSLSSCLRLLERAPALRRKEVTTSLFLCDADWSLIFFFFCFPREPLEPPFP